jgi:hypothetical protein
LRVEHLTEHAQRDGEGELEGLVHGDQALDLDEGDAGPHVDADGAEDLDGLVPRQAVADDAGPALGGEGAGRLWVRGVDLVPSELLVILVGQADLALGCGEAVSVGIGYFERQRSMDGLTIRATLQPS